MARLTVAPATTNVPSGNARTVRAMRAWQVARHGVPRDVLELVDIEVPEPRAGEVRLRVLAAAIGLPDARMCRDAYAFRPPVPFVPGQEVCGVVDAVGEGVDRSTGLAIGARVMAVTSFPDGHGGFAEYTLAPAGSCFRVPDDMTIVDAAAFRIGWSTAWIGLVRRGALQPGEWLLVLGAAGGSGVAAVQLGHALGARVIAVASDADKLALCGRAGADVVIDRTTQSVVEVAREVTGKAGVDVVYDPVGGAPAAETIRCLARGGRLLAIGFASGSWVPVDVRQLVARNASVVGVYAALDRAELEDDHEALLALVAAGRLTPATTAVPFADLRDALDTVDRGAALGKLVAVL
jgi:NADPH2:quinone reductase